MNIKDIIPTLEQCKELKKNGWINETIFGWYEGPMGIFPTRNNYDINCTYYAPTINELLEESDLIQMNTRQYDSFWMTTLDDDGYCPSFCGRTLLELLINKFCKITINEMKYD